MPHVRGVAPKFGLQEWTCGEVPCFVHSVEQRVCPMDEPPRLLSQHRKIKCMNIAKAHPTSILRSAQFAPIDPMNFLLIPGLPPPILSQHWVHPITHNSRNFEDAHWVRRYRLGHRLNKDFSPSLKDIFFLPPHHPFRDPFLEILKGTDFWSTCAPNIDRIFSWTSRHGFLLKNNAVFWRLITCPEAFLYWVSTSINRWNSSIFALLNSRLSSVKRKWEMRTPPWQEVSPFKWWVSIAFRSKEESPSAQKRKRYGDNGSPCLIPLEGETYPQGSPLIMME